MRHEPQARVNGIAIGRWKTRIVKAMPRELEGSLPTVEQLEAELGKRKVE